MNKDNNVKPIDEKELDKATGGMARPGDHKWKCTLCDKVFKDFASYREHNEMAHGNK